MTQTESEVSDLDKEGIFKLLSQMYEDYNRDNGSGISVGGYGFIYVEREFPHLTKKEINKTIDDWYNKYSFGENGIIESKNAIESYVSSDDVILDDQYNMLNREGTTIPPIDDDGYIRGYNSRPFDSAPADWESN